MSMFPSPELRRTLSTDRRAHLRRHADGELGSSPRGRLDGRDGRTSRIRRG